MQRSVRRTRARGWWVSELSVEGAGVWRSILPFQIELGDRRSGVRGYAGAHEAGGQRVVDLDEVAAGGRVDDVVAFAKSSEIDFSNAFAMLASPIWQSEPFLVFAHHAIARAGAFAATTPTTAVAWI